MKEEEVAGEYKSCNQTLGSIPGLVKIHYRPNTVGQLGSTLKAERSKRDLTGQKNKQTSVYSR